MTDNVSDAEKYRLEQVRKIMNLFEEANGKPAANIKELSTWVGSSEGSAVLSRHHDERGKIIP